MTDGASDRESVQLEFEGLTLLSTLDELLVLCTMFGWRHNARPDLAGSQNVFVHLSPGHPVRKFKLIYETGRLVGITGWYRNPDVGRHSIRERYPRSRHDGEGWVMCDADEQTLVQIDDAGGRLQILHTGAMADRAEVERLYRFFLPRN